MPLSDSFAFLFGRLTYWIQTLSSSAMMINSFLWPLGQLMTINGVGVEVNINFKILQYCCHAPIVPCVFLNHQISVESNFDTVL